MNEQRVTFHADDEVAPKITALVRDAQKWVVLVTPYLDFWGHLKDAIEIAVKKNGIKITAIVRSDPKVLSGEDVAWLVQLGVKVLSIEDLHAKIYFNERTTLVSSMNLTASSTNNHEFALVVQDEQVAQQIRKYVVERVGPLTKPVNGIKAPLPPKVSTKPTKSTTQSLGGFCIRCSERIPLALDPFRPLCQVHYEVWARWGDEDYPEDFCHACGRQVETTYAKPFCRQCYRRLFNA